MTAPDEKSQEITAEITPEFSIITTAEQFNALAQQWNDLFAAHGKGHQLFQTYNWIWHWINQFEKTPRNLSILIGKIDNDLVLAAPMVITRPLGLKIIKWIGEPVSQYGDILMKVDVNNPLWLKEGFNYLNKSLKPDLFHMRKIRFDANITPLAEIYNATLLEETAAPYIEIRGDKDFTEFNKRYSQRSRKSKRRHRRKLEEKGEVTFALYEESAEANRAANHAITLKRQWLKATKTMSPAFRGSVIDRFFDNASQPNDHPAGIRVSELCVENHPAALEIGVLVKDYYGAHLGAYDPAYIAHSPGSLQMQDTIAALINQGVKTIDLFAPADGYKLEWTEQTVPVYDFSYSTSIFGKLYEHIYLLTLRPGLKLSVRKLTTIVKRLKSLFRRN